MSKRGEEFEPDIFLSFPTDWKIMTILLVRMMMIMTTLSKIIMTTVGAKTTMVVIMLHFGWRMAMLLAVARIIIEERGSERVVDRD